MCSTGQQCLHRFMLLRRLLLFQIADLPINHSFLCLLLSWHCSFFNSPFNNVLFCICCIILSCLSCCCSCSIFIRVFFSNIPADSWLGSILITSVNCSCCCCIIDNPGNTSSISIVYFDIPIDFFILRCFFLAK